MKKLAMIGPAASGKTAFAVGLALKLQEAGVTIGYYKPIAAARPGQPPADDEDVRLMQAVLDLPLPVEELASFSVSSQYLSRYPTTDEGERDRRLNAISAAANKAGAGHDLLIIGGQPLPFAMAGVGLDALSVSRHLGAAAVLVTRVDSDFSLDRAILYNEYAAAKGVTVLGNILNHVPRTLVDKAEGVYRPLLEQRGFKVLGVLPRRPELTSPTVHEVQEAIGADVLCCDDQLDRTVEDVLVGAMTLESALPTLKRSFNKCLITGGDRADLALAALETDTSCVVLTGGAYPDVRVMARARERHVPVLLTNLDTYTALERLHQLSRKLTPTDSRGIGIARQAVEELCDWEYVREWVQQA